MNSTIDLLKNHSSFRSFEKKPVSNEQRDTIFQAASHSSSFSLLQTVSIIRISDQALRKKVNNLCFNQPYIEEAGEFWIFCADFNRNHQMAPSVDLSYIEYLLIGTFDAGIMAQNALTAAESLGLGGVYIGAVRGNIQELSDLLELPEYVIPLVGLCIGHPKGEKPDSKPKLPQEIVMSENTYKPLDKDSLDIYDQQMKHYYENRSSRAPFTARTVKGWSDHIQDHLERSSLTFMKEYLNKQGFAKK
ncbi:oxygen-insensitive NADPH nitroreductase [Alkalicoccobacillus murimartini]|uniref:Nitroreductase n=1 Tax=Alkalicoccobacillus murimartini TaxID=171685 RepID=A0ABT9YLB7_9BACI|nr:oxygen-insensitive NADPH nitroreductase [Alkalicoccobacillus murimartini]MDQ0208655.1 nitroreductase [Alkalicoccobacillus murimartini]